MLDPLITIAHNAIMIKTMPEYECTTIIIVNAILQFNLPCKSSEATSVEACNWTPLEHDTVTPERSVGVSVVIVEVSGDFDVWLKWYSTLD